MTTTLTTLQDKKYDLRGYLMQINHAISFWPQTVSVDLDKTIKDPATKPAQMFWLVITQRSALNSYFNPVIAALLLLPAAQACNLLQKHRLLTQDYCNSILESENPEELNDAILLLSKNTSLVKDTVDLIIKHVAPLYAAHLIVRMSIQGIPVSKSSEVFYHLEYCLQLMQIKPITSWVAEVALSVEFDLAGFLSLLKNTSIQISDKNLKLFEQHFVLSVPANQRKEKLKQLVLGMHCLKEADLLNYENYMYLLKHIQSKALFDIIQMLHSPQQSSPPVRKLLTAQSYKLAINAPNIDKLCCAMNILHYWHSLSEENFLELIDHPEPHALASILHFLQMYRNVHNITLREDEYYCLKKTLNICQFAMVLDKTWPNEKEFHDLIEYSDILFNPDETDNWWQSIEWKDSHRSTILNVLIQQCKYFQENQITDRKEQIAMLLKQVEELNDQIKNKKNRFFLYIKPVSPHLEQIKTMVEHLPKKELLIAFHTDKHHTLREAVTYLKLDVTQFSSEQKNSLEGKWDSEAFFNSISAEMIEFIQKRGPKNEVKNKHAQRDENEDVTTFAAMN